MSQLGNQLEPSMQHPFPQAFGRTTVEGIEAAATAENLSTLEASTELIAKATRKQLELNASTTNNSATVQI